MSVLVVWRCEAAREELLRKYVTRKPVAHQSANPARPGVVLIDLWESEEEFRRVSGVPVSDVIGIYDAGPAELAASPA